MYEPKLARFMSRDPLPDNGVDIFYPVPDMRKYGRQVVHVQPYVYALNNPLSYSDPSGLQAQDNRCSGSFCSTIGPHGFSEGMTHISASIVGGPGVPCYGATLKLTLRENHSVFMNGRFVKCGQPATREIEAMFRDGGDFDFGWYDFRSGTVSLPGCTVTSNYRKDRNGCYDLMWDIECPLYCDTERKCAVDVASFILGAWKKDPRGELTGQVYDISAFFMQVSVDIDLESECCNFLGCNKVAVGYQWAVGQNPLPGGPGQTTPKGPLPNNCKLADFPPRTGRPVGPGNP